MASVRRAAAAVLLLAVAVLGCHSPSESGGAVLPVTTPTATLRPSATATSRPTATPAVTATGVPYVAPALLDPPPAAGVSGPAVRLRWKWEGKLNEDEWFDLWVWPRGQGARSIHWTKAVESDSIPPGGVGFHFWKVRIVKGRPGQPESVALSPWSETRSFDYRGPQVSATPTPLLPHPSPTGA